MIISELVRFAQTQMDLPPFGYALTRVSWLVKLTAGGDLVGLEFIGASKGSGSPLLAPMLIRSYSIKPKLLVDTSEYVFGIVRDPKRATKARQAQEAFVDLTRACAVATGELSVKAVLHFLENQVTSLHTPDSFEPTQVVSFEVDGVSPIELESVRAFWAKYVEGRDSPEMNCLVTGETGPVVKRLPHKIRGVPYGQSTGTTLVSANAPAFEHYGLSNTQNAPISPQAAEALGQALNFLVNSPAHHVIAGNLVYVFWSKEEQHDILGVLETPDLARVRRLLAVRVAGESDERSTDKLFILALSASGGRAAVRDWSETTFSDTLVHLETWFEAQRVVGEYGQEAQPLSLRSLAHAVAPDERDGGAFGGLYASLLRHALRGGRLDTNILVRALARNRSERNVTRGRAALVKLVLASQGFLMDDMHALNEEPALTGLDNKAYICGRLIAVVEKVQRASVAGINVSLVDRYYGSASTTPALVFPGLVSSVKPHLRRLKRSRPSTAYVLGQLIERLFGQLNQVPTTLTALQQGFFSLGYYHQRAAERIGILDARAELSLSAVNDEVR